MKASLFLNLATIGTWQLSTCLSTILLLFQHLCFLMQIYWIKHHSLENFFGCCIVLCGTAADCGPSKKPHCTPLTILFWASIAFMYKTGPAKSSWHNAGHLQNCSIGAMVPHAYFMNLWLSQCKCNTHTGHWYIETLSKHGLDSYGITESSQFKLFSDCGFISNLNLNQAPNAPLF